MVVIKAKYSIIIRGMPNLAQQSQLQPFCTCLFALKIWLFLLGFIKTNQGFRVPRSLIIAISLITVSTRFLHTHLVIWFINLRNVFVSFAVNIFSGEALRTEAMRAAESDGKERGERKRGSIKPSQQNLYSYSFRCTERCI